MFLSDFKDYPCFEVGDIIKVYSKLSWISRVPIWHYGVVVGYDEVVHFNKEDILGDIRIIKTSISEFVNGGTKLQLCHMSLLNANYDADERAKRALSKVGTDFGGYNLKNNNCEHFANWCATGHKYSNQILQNEEGGHSVGEKLLEKSCEPLCKTLHKIDNFFDSGMADEVSDAICDTVENVIDFAEDCKDAIQDFFDDLFLF